MSDGVKTIFKVIMGSMVFMVLSVCIIELFNITITAPMLKSVSYTTLSRSCDFFAQESYKDGSGNGHQLVGYNNSIDSSLNGVFYLGTDRDVYNRLYSTSDFGVYANNFKNKYRKLKVLAKALGHTGDALYRGEDSIGRYYADGLVTPLNLGLVYLDKETLTKIFKWNLVATLMGGRNDLLITHPEDGSRPYVAYSGFRVYYNTIRITGVRYRLFDLFDSQDAKDYEKLTNIEVSNYLNKSGIEQSDERRYVMVALVDYSMKVGYEGITPIKRVFQWALNTHENQNYDRNDALSEKEIRNEDSWNPDDSKWQGDTALSRLGARNGDITDGNNDFGSVFDVDSKIVYYLVR